MTRKNSESALFIDTYRDQLDLLFTRAISNMVEGLFLESADYEAYLKDSEQEAFEQGVFTADIFGNHVDVILEMSKDLNLTSQNIMFEIIENMSMDSSERLFLYKRLMECNWTRFTGYAEGYLSNKNKQIDHLHEQKIAVMGQMAAGMAHEIRNPLASIKGFAQLVNHRLCEPVIQVNELRAYLDITIKEIDALNGLVTDFLVLSRRGDSSKSDAKVFNIIEVLHRVNNIVNQLILSDDISLTVHYTQEPLLTLGNASQLEQVFLNILKNSIDAFSSFKGCLEITAATDPDNHEIILRFTDNGDGIPQEVLNRIFDPFFTTKAKGTGIGLSICRQLIEMYGGRIVIDSTIHVGTTVTIILPWISSEQE
ncbi:ATP-binding protein [Paenibacillus sp. PK3_47]|uniref:sensor histidine kinase n=1 Tax=Paenibacillus sp. PK3_47 TaxID=2072642 RepID=UPI00201E5178|nr:ATP-binding protein [Paenibacillus sp. PK3_47]